MPELEEALPKYRQIANLIRDQILRGDLRPGDEVPSERALATTYGVSRPTATKALEILRMQGFVESRQGSGSYVADVRARSRARERYRRARDRGRIYPPDEYATIVAAELADPAPEHVLRTLGLPEGTSAIRRRRITNGPEGPREVSTSWFDGRLAEAARRLLERERIVEGTPAYVEAVTGRQVRYAQDRACARLADATEAEELRLAGGTGSPVLAFEHVTFDAADRPVEFTEAVYPPDRWTYEQEYSLP